MAVRRVHLLDVGEAEYGDCVYAELEGTSILIDGAHSGDDELILNQLESIRGTAETPFTVDLLVISHCHDDHIGCLPSLVADGNLTARWVLAADPDFGWGKVAGQDATMFTDDIAATVVAGLREEPLDLRRASDDVVAAYLADAVTLEDRYRTMLSTLRRDGGTVVRFQRDRTDQERLLREFRAVGLELLGPSATALRRCQQLLAGTAVDAARQIDAFRSDGATDIVSLFRTISMGTDAQRRVGQLINMQSIITRFSVGSLRVLCGGDYQFADPQTTDATIVGERDRLIRKISDGAPYDFVKLGHHGSDNAVDDAFLDAIDGTPLVGICAGSRSSHHPNPATLALLAAEHAAGDFDWFRTDKNGHVTIDLKADGSEVTIESGGWSDPRPNRVGRDVSLTAPTVSTPPLPVPASASSGPSVETVTLPPVMASPQQRITVTIDISPPNTPTTLGFATSAPQDRAPVSSRPRAPMPIAGGRDVSHLLFVTHVETLAANIGITETEYFLDSIRAAAPLLALPADARTPKAVTDALATELGTRPDVRGIVILGGYDVVPTYRVDTLSPELRANAAALRAGDLDDFTVYSDDPHVDADAGTDRLPDVAISRIPDAGSRDFLINALQVEPSRREHTRGGIRNVHRPFADAIFESLGGTRKAMLRSYPTVANAIPPELLDGQRGYIMLHGDVLDGQVFSGENEAGQTLPAFRTDQVPKPAPDVVFAGCCWGALTVSTTANRALPGVPVPTRSVGQSLALTFLDRGSTAFVGCTGAHWSPVQPPYNNASGPMHQYFWEELGNGTESAVALMNAKRRYAGEFPSITDPVELAIRYKTLTQFTCLGLGW